MNPDLLEQLKALFASAPAAPADATRAPSQYPQIPTIGAPTGTRLPPEQKGIMASILRSAAPSPDTPGGMVNEMFNPIRAGAQARELVGQASRALRQGNIGMAAGMGALAAMAVPGVPDGPLGRSLASAARAADNAAPLARDAIYVNRADEMRRVPTRPVPEAHQQAFNKFFGESKVRTPEGQPAVVVHGTPASRLGEGIDEVIDFKAFRLPTEGRGQLGIHVGTDPRQTDFFSTHDPYSGMFSERWGQAPLEEKMLYAYNNTKAYGRSMPLYARVENPLRLPDLSSWSPGNVLPAVKLTNPSAYDRIADVAKRENISLDNLTEKGLRNLLELSGYDGIVYRNKFEGVPFSVHQQLTKTEDALKASPAGRPSNTALAVAIDMTLQKLWPQAGDAYIVFRPNQLKSAIGNVGTYDRRWRDLSRGIVGVAGTGAAASAAQSSRRPEEQ